MTHDKYEGDDSEYHFSDDQVNYEAEPTVMPTSTATASPQGAAALAAFNQYRRPIVGVGVFVVLIFLVYKILAPSSTSAPNTDFSQANSSATMQSGISATKSGNKITAQQQITPGAPAVQATSASTPEVAPVTQTISQPAVTTPPPAAPTTVANTAQAPAANQQPTLSIQPGASAPQEIVPASPMNSQSVASAPTTMPPTATVLPAGQMSAPQQQYVNQPPAAVGTPSDRLSLLESQNAKLQGDVSQFEAQNTALQSKLQEMSMRMASMETTLVSLGKMLQENRMPRRSAETTIVARPAPMPHIAYSVQAIIPGRAWLKAESGETVTVAEGDVVKGLGRVVKIDPYDGVVSIDIGGRLATLSYGNSTEQ